MPGAQPRQSPQARQGSSVVRGTRAAAPGAHKVSRGQSATGPSAGVQEVFVEPYDEAVSFARGYVHITFDPDGTYTAP